MLAREPQGVRCERLNTIKQENSHPSGKPLTNASFHFAPSASSSLMCGTHCYFAPSAFHVSCCLGRVERANGTGHLKQLPRRFDHCNIHHRAFICDGCRALTLGFLHGREQALMIGNLL